MSQRKLFEFALKFQKKRAVPEVQKGTVLLHQFFPTRGMPSISPPCLKLETYLRMAQIPYKNHYSMTPSSKGKLPWITFNGHDVADSNLCIEFLNKEFGVDLNQGLTDMERGASMAFRRMCDENTYWGLVYHRWMDNFENTRKHVFVSMYHLHFLAFGFTLIDFCPLNLVLTIAIYVYRAKR